MRLEGKVAIVTGGAGGMGSAQARLFVKEGAAVVVADLNAEGGRGVVGEIVAAGGRAVFAELDVRDSGQWEACVALAESEFGALHVLCNNAGANRRVSFDEIDEETWRWVLDVNLTGQFLGIKACVPAMRRAGGGSIINMGSLSAVRPGFGSPAYAASKTGLWSVTLSTAAQCAADNIRCNMVSPGHVDTQFIRADLPHSPNDWSTSVDNPENYNRRLEAIPMGKFQTPEDVAPAFLFLASDEASMITGAHLPVDGGTAI